MTSRLTQFDELEVGDYFVVVSRKSLLVNLSDGSRKRGDVFNPDEILQLVYKQPNHMGVCVVCHSLDRYNRDETELRPRVKPGTPNIVDFDQVDVKKVSLELFDSVLDPLGENKPVDPNSPIPQIPQISVITHRPPVTLEEIAGSIHFLTSFNRPIDNEDTRVEYEQVRDNLLQGIAQILKNSRPPMDIQ